MSDDDYCEFCGVSLDLHPTYPDDPDEDCDIAIRKAEMLDKFWQPFTNRGTT